VQSTTAAIAAPIGARAQTTTVRVEYGPTDTYGLVTAVQTLAAAEPSVTLNFALIDLPPATTLHYRVVAGNATGTTHGPDATFTTAAPAPAAVDVFTPPEVDAPAPAIPLATLKKIKAGPKAAAPPVVQFVGSATVQVTEAGAAALTVGCPASASNGCHGTIVLREALTKAKSKKKSGAVASRCARGCRPLGQAKFEVKAGKSRKMSINLVAGARKLLARTDSLKARISVTTVAGSKSTTATRLVTLRLHV
jgi:hypothetical protein